MSLFDYTAAQNTAKLLDKVSAKLGSAKSVTASCIISTGGNTETALLTMSGRRFRLQSPGLEIWYDGKTQWVYSEQTNEVTITEPTAEELAQTNPLAVIDFFKKNYSETSATAKNGLSRMILKAKGNDLEIRTAEITVNNSTLMPSTIDLKMSNGMKVAITVSNVKTGTALSDATFRYDKKFHPGAEVIDLR